MCNLAAQRVDREGAANRSPAWLRGEIYYVLR